MNALSSHGPDSVLVIDDDEVSLAVLSMILEADGICVTQASSGEMAIGLVESLTPERFPRLVLADLQMPGICGPELASILRRRLPEARLLAMSATPGDIEGYNGFVAKPIEMSLLREALEGKGQTLPQPAESLKDAGILDEAVYKRLAGMMPQAALKEVYEACLADALDRAEKMRTAAGKDDVKEVRRHAHAVKGSAGMLGARDLAAVAQDLETGSYQPEDVPLKIDNFLFCCSQLKRILLDKQP